MIENNIKLNYDDVVIVPEVVSTIESRKECNPFDEYGNLPIFTAPMSNVVSIENMNLWKNSHIIPIIPRNIDIETRLFLAKNDSSWVAFSLNETIDNFIKKYFETVYNSIRICIDMANGHMLKLISTISELKHIYGDRIQVMSGNIGNPQTYLKYEEAGCDYVRCNIGSGSACTTSSNVGCGYGPISLLEEIYDLKVKNGCKCKIIADGGIKGYRDIQKALIYADYVMIGGIFNRCIDSAASTKFGKFYWNINGRKIFRPLKTLIKYGKVVGTNDYQRAFDNMKAGKCDLWKSFYGMSTKIAQKEFSGDKNIRLKTSEGRAFEQKVEYTISGWVENEIDYLRSAMSYTNSRNLEEYKNSSLVRIPEIRYNK